METAAPFDLLNLVADVTLDEIERAIEYHSQQVDCLRLLRKIVEIRSEASAPLNPQIWPLVPIATPVDEMVEPEQYHEPVCERRATITANHVSRTGRMPIGRPRAISKTPTPGTYAAKILKVLAGRGEMQTGEIAAALGVESEQISRALREWTKKGVIEKVRWAYWRLAPSVEEKAENLPIPEPNVGSGDDSTPPCEEPAQSAASFPTVSDQVRKYLEFNQPAKPLTIAIDTGHDVADVLAALEGCESFRKSDRGWLLARALQS